MLTKVTLYFLSLSVTSAKSMDDNNLLVLTPKELVNSVKNVLRSSYLRELVNDFAAKTAEHLIKELQNKGKQVTGMVSEKAQRRPTRIEDHRNKNRNFAILKEEEVLTLLKDPSPDGDNLEKESAYLSDTEIVAGDSTRIPYIPVIGKAKINGIYFRRLLGFI